MCAYTYTITGIVHPCSTSDASKHEYFIILEMLGAARHNVKDAVGQAHFLATKAVRERANDAAEGERCAKASHEKLRDLMPCEAVC